MLNVARVEICGEVFMVKYTYEALTPDEPIVIYTALDGWYEALDESDAEGNEMIRSAKEPLFWILDLSRIRINITTMMVLANKYLRGSEAMWQHPNIRQLCIITGDDLVVKMAAGIASSDLFGNQNIKVFQSREDTLAFAQAEMNREW